MFRNHSPKCARVRSADRFAFIQDRSISCEQGRVDDIRVSNNPADIGRRPEHFARVNTVDVFHRPLQGDDMAAVIPHYAFWLSGCTGSVDDIERIGSFNGHTVCGYCICHYVIPVVITTGSHFCFYLRTLINDASCRFVCRQVDRSINQRLIFNGSAWFKTTGSCNDGNRFCIINANCKFV